jgi:7-cyano-7-deazaguanine synthase
MRDAVVLLSGGLDSAATLAMAIAEGYRAYAMTFRYGQRHSFEIEAASRVAEVLGATDHVLVDIDLRMFGKSALTDELDVPKRRSAAEMGVGIPVTYVPARNTVFLSFALAWAESLSAFDIFVGVNALDYAGYPDCRPEYIAAYEAMANLATKSAIESANRYRIHAPLIRMTKAEIIRKGRELGVDFGVTSSCYDPSADGVACGLCDACLLRLQGFAENGVDDPVRYAHMEGVAT